MIPSSLDPTSPRHPLLRRTRAWLLCGGALLTTPLGCSGGEGEEVGSGGSVGTGGAATGGAATGGAASGGAASGGAASGGAATGGAATGGAATGGAATGGAATGGAATGGAEGTGGAEPSGGASSGGAASGGSEGTGGAQGGFQPCPATGPCKILPLGDSITEDVTQPGGAWRIEFFSRAVADGKDITFVGSRANGPQMVDGQAFPRSHEGTSGITINGLNGKIPSPGLDDPPHIILLHIGTNDMANNSSGAPAALESLVDELIAEAPDALLVVSSIVPFINVEAYNATIEPLVEEKAAEGAHILFADQYSAFPDGGMSNDGVHPNPEGYAAMGGVYYDIVQEYLP